MNEYDWVQHLVTDSFSLVTRERILIIVRYLKESGKKTVTGKTVWSANVIQKILMNKKYMGDMIL